MKKNAFKKQIPEIKELLEIDAVRAYVSQTLVSVLNTLGVDGPEEIVSEVVSIARSYGPIGSYEARANEILESRGVTKQKIGEKLSGRADLIYNQIKDYIRGRVLDLGCGDGRVGERISKEGLEVILADVYKHDHIQETRLPFYVLNQGERAPLEDGHYDTVLLLTVMHHSENPIKGTKNLVGTMEEAKRLAKKGGRIIVIESVYGVMPGQADNAEDFAKLSHENQRLANIFFDHFYNRIIHYTEDPSKKVNVPFNFNTPEGWNEEAKMLGMKVVATKHLGIDQATVPEYHTLHIFKV